MSIEWPSSLPQYFLRAGFSHSRPNNLISTQMDRGPAKVRRRNLAGVGKMSGSMVMTLDQWNDFENFIDNTLAGGVLSFLFPDPLNPGSYLTVKFDPTATIGRTPFAENKFSVPVALDIQP